MSYYDFYGQIQPGLAQGAAIPRHQALGMQHQSGYEHLASQDALYPDKLPGLRTEEGFSEDALEAIGQDAVFQLGLGHVDEDDELEDIEYEEGDSTQEDDYEDFGFRPRRRGRPGPGPRRGPPRRRMDQPPPAVLRRQRRRDPYVFGADEDLYDTPSPHALSPHVFYAPSPSPGYGFAPNYGHGGPTYGSHYPGHPGYPHPYPAYGADPAMAPPAPAGAPKNDSFVESAKTGAGLGLGFFGALLGLNLLARLLSGR